MQRLQAAFPETPREAMEQLLMRHSGDAGQTLNQLLIWSPEELRQSLQDADGREIFTWRVPLEQCQ